MQNYSKLLKNREYLLVGLITIVCFIVSWNGIHSSIVGGIVSLFISTVPGYLLAKLINIQYRNDIQAVYTNVCLSASFHITIGLLINTILPLLGINNPLSHAYIVFTEYVVIMLFWIFAFRKAVSFHFTKISGIFKTHFIKLLQLAGIILATTLSINILNNEGTNVFLFITIGLTIIYVFYIILKSHSFSDDYLKISLFVISFSFLSLYSLRSWHISGYDISQEFQVFGITKSVSIWSMSNFKDSYNACLSINILPIIINNLTGIDGEYIFKLLYQLFFALFPLIMFDILRLYVAKTWAFIATFWLIVQVTYFQQMPSILRQEIALVFYAIFIYYIFENNLPKSKKLVMQMIFGASMIVSHYSTTYIALGTLIAAYMTIKILNILKLDLRLMRFLHKSDLTQSITNEPKLNGILLGTLLMFTFMWNSQITGTSSNVLQLSKSIFANFKDTLRTDNVERSMQQLFFPNPLDNADNSIKSYPLGIQENYKILRPYIIPYDIKTLSLFKFEVDNVPNIHGITSVQIKNLSYKAFYIVKFAFTNIFVSLGLGIAYLLWLRSGYLDREYIVVATIGFCLIIALILFPQALKEYNLTRMYLQQLMFLSIFTVLGFMKLSGLFKINSRSQIVMISCAIIYAFLCYSGWIFQIVGGTSTMLLNNRGLDMEKAYTYSTDVVSAQWLGKIQNDSLVFTTYPGRNRLQAFGNIDRSRIVTDTLPNVLDKYSYVYMLTTNTINNRAYAWYRNNEFFYTYPSTFLNMNKNLVYSNHESKVYK